MDSTQLLAASASLWEEVRAKNPLVHCITNYVTINDVANVIIAAGASPAMVEHPDEAAVFTPMAAALYINIGTLTDFQQQGIIAAAQAARDHGVPGVLDPVGCGVLANRVYLSHELMSLGFVKVVKGNGAEIKSLAGLAGKAKGVDSLEEGEGLVQACRDLSRQHQTTVVATGRVDVVAGPKGVATISNGTDYFQRITGAGCMVGGVIAACLGVNPQDPWLAGITGLLAFNIAGELAARRIGNRGPGSFRQAFTDALHHLTKEDILKEGRVTWQDSDK
ncbi:MAG TPA: hydroxyethylthiazole kinase [Clostridia bacterium]|nr:hydroxyethylthiazole kinase [Clostridia bacterium]